MKKRKNQIIQGRLYKINKKIKKRIPAKYHKIKYWTGCVDLRPIPK